jgi:hypothetical protein
MATASQAQSPQAPSKMRLVPTENVESGIPAQPFGLSIVCDRDRNLYLMSVIDDLVCIHKLSPSGRQLAVLIASALPHLDIKHGGHFSVSANGDIYQLAFLRSKPERLVVVWNKDGSLKSTIRLSPGFTWVPTQLAEFSSGDLLVTGRYLKNRKTDLAETPFTGIFSPDGTLKKQVILPDDEEIRRMAEVGDNRIVPAVGGRDVNTAIDMSLMEAGDDGNIYLLRQLSPAILYAVAPDGAVLRRFTVDPGRTDFLPQAMHIIGNKIAIEFLEPQSLEFLIKTVDLNGRELGTYEEAKDPDGRGLVNSVAFACYSDKPERFKYLYTAKDGNLGRRTAEPRP